MQASFLAVCGTAAIMLVSALAEGPARPALHPESLARQEAITAFCAKADPASQTDYAAKLASALNGRSDGEIQRDRATRRYKRAMAQANQVLSQVPVGADATTACSNFLAENY